MATQSAFASCVRRVEAAFERLSTLALMPDGQQLMKALSEAKVTLEFPEVDVTSLNLDPIFALCKKIMVETEAFEFAEAVKALESRFSTAASLMSSWLDPDDDPFHFFLKMEELATRSGKLTWRTLDQGHDLLEDVFVAVNAAKMDAVENKCTRPYQGWQIDREGKSARFAEPFLATQVAMDYDIWLGERPAATANYKDIRAWIDRGFKLKDQLEAPWGICQTCGKNKILPWHDEKSNTWKPNRVCRDCHKVNKPSDSKSPSVRQPANVISEETVKALKNDLSFLGITVETVRARVVGGSSAGRPEESDELESDTDEAKPPRVRLNKADVEAEAEVAQVEPIGKKRGSSKPKKTTTSKPKTAKATTATPKKKGKGVHPIQEVDGTLA